MDSTMTMTHANASVEIHQLASILTITTQTLVNVTVALTTVTQANTLILRAVAANALNTRHVQTINTSMAQLASVNAVM